MRFHVIALPHTKTTKEFSACAFTQKVLNFCEMMTSLGHEVYHYGAEGSEAKATEKVTVITTEEQEMYWGNNDWRNGQFFDIEFDSTLPYWQLFNNNVIEALGDRLNQQDFICVIGGYAHKPIADAFPDHMTVEFGVGYEGIFAKYRVFESYAWMHYLYGRTNQNDGSYYDAVIPNYYDPSEFAIGEKEDYALFVARLIPRKGPEVAVEATRAAGMKLLMAGQGFKGMQGDLLKAQDFAIANAAHVEHVGVVGVEERKALMSKAKVLIIPTQYIGPFEGVAIEAMLSGTPVIASDWGAFAETIPDGHTGYRARTLGEHVWALQNLDKLDSPQAIREYAIERYSMDVVKYRYQAYFEQLLTLWDKGWSDLEAPFAEEKRVQGHFS